MRLRTSAVVTLIFVIFTASCSSSAATGEPAGASGGAPALGGRTRPADDAAAMADLQASEKWTAPRCRWLESGGHVVPSVQEEALYVAASQMTYIEMTQVGQEFHLNRQAPALRIALTDRGKSVSATCGPTSRPTSWGVPVSERRFVSGTFTQQEPGGRTVYAVDFIWIPTPVGDQVQHVLTSQPVESGSYRVKVYMQRNRGATGSNGWTVMSIDDRGAQKTQ